MTLFGWDASDFDWARGPMDLAAARADGIDFFTHKATEGTGVKHVRYGEALNRARAAGIPFLGAYIVIRSGSVAAQVDYFLSYLDAQTPWWRAMSGFFIQVDLEHWPYDQVPPQQGVAAADLLRQRSGKWVVLYAPQWAYGNTIDGSDPLWASAYGGNPAVPYRQAYPGDGDGKRWQAYSGRTPVFLQYGSTTVIGSQHTCDANAFRGTLADLSRLIAGGANASGFPPFQSGDDMPKIFRVDQTGVTGITSGSTWSYLASPEAVSAACRVWGIKDGLDRDGGGIIAINDGDLPGMGQQVFPPSAGGGGSVSGPVDLSAKALDDVEKRVDRQLDQQSRGGVDND